MTYRTLAIDEYLSQIASENVTPAGGTATAVVGAIGTSLCEMACIHTVEKPADEADHLEIAEILESLRKQRDHLLEFADRDAEVIDELFTESPSDTDERLVKRSIGVPLTIARASLNVLELAETVTSKGNQRAVGDAGTGVMLVRSAFQAAVFTARCNLDLVADQTFAEEVAERTIEMEREAEAAYEKAFGHIERRT